MKKENHSACCLVECWGLHVLAFYTRRLFIFIVWFFALHGFQVEVMIKKNIEDLTNYVPNTDAYEEGAVGCLMWWLVIIIIIKREKIYFLIIFSVLLNLNQNPN